MSKPRSASVRGDTDRAVEAWRALGPDSRAPSAVEKLYGRKPTSRSVYRLSHATEDGDSVIAKRYATAVHSIERVFYREVLPLLPVSTPRFYGELEAGDGHAWIFLEDVGTQRFSPDDPEHRVLAARWLGGMHAAGPDLHVDGRLHDRGPGHYRRHLDAGRRLIHDNLGNPALQTDDGALLRSVLSQYDTVESRWDELEEICAAGPSTLVHGDFRPKNVFVHRTAGKPARLLPIDWETAGWGTPAADLAPMRHHYVSQVDLEAYCDIVRSRWPDFDVDLGRRLMWVGLIFRRLAAMEWAAMSLVYPQSRVLRGPLADIRLYQEQVGRALEGEWGVPA